MIAVAIDGPAGAGKSSIAREAARELGYLYVDTGALYRAIGHYALQKGVNPADGADVAALLGGIHVALRYVQGEQRVFLNEEDVSSAIRTPEVSMAASAVSAHPAVRDFLLELQRGIARENDVIMDGRDIGTVVLPSAQLKFFLTATPEERARRRFLELKQKGQEADYEQVLKEIRQRDYNDENRAVAPLKPAPGAIQVDTTGKTLEQSAALLVGMIKERLL